MLLSKKKKKHKPQQANVPAVLRLPCPSHLPWPPSGARLNPSRTSKGFSRRTIPWREDCKLPRTSKEIPTKTLIICNSLLVVPKQDYRYRGTPTAVKSVIKAVPVALLSQLIGLAEASAKSLIGLFVFGFLRFF